MTKTDKNAKNSSSLNQLLIKYIHTMAENTAPTESNDVNVKIDLTYNIDHSQETLFEAMGINLETNEAFKDFFTELVSGDTFEGKKQSEIVEIVLKKQNPELIKVLLVGGIHSTMENVQAFQVKQLMDLLKGGDLANFKA
jgi:hypothetical protein